LVEGIKGAAVNERGEVTLGQLLRYVQETVPQYVKRDLGADRQQRPFAKVEGYKAEDLVISVITPPSTAIIKETQAVPPIDPAAIELAYWETIKESKNPDDFRAYLKEYPKGRFAALARIRAVTPDKTPDTSLIWQNIPPSILQPEATTPLPNSSRISARVRSDNTGNGWTNSGVVVRRGQRLSITASGTISIGEGYTSTPEGISARTDSHKLMSSYPTGALIAVIGDDNDDFIFIGQKREFVAQRDGVLFLGVNEGKLEDNTGAYDVAVEVQTATTSQPTKFFQITARVRSDNTGNGWTNSGLVVRSGQRIRITASGRVTLGEGRMSTAAGLPAVPDSEKLMRAFPTGALIAVIGDDNNDFIFIGAHGDFIAPRDGVLFLGVNEGNLNDNSGVYDVVIEAEAPGSAQ
jgi:hypothetical protein